MIHDPQHTLTHVSVESPATLQLVFADGAMFRLDLATTIQAHAALAALADSEVFDKARLDARGGYVVWIDDDLEMAADILRHLAVDQSSDGHNCGTGSNTYRPITSTGKQGVTS
jgi:hypothetical protein